MLGAEERGDGRAALALEMVCDGVRKYIGTYLAVLGGADAVVFGGGIGEHAPQIRERVLDGMGWCGLTLDPECNANAVGVEAKVTTEASKLHAYVVLVDEETRIAEDTAHLLATSTEDDE